MIHPRTRSEVRSQYNFKFDLGASTLDAPPPPWEAQRPPGIEFPSRLPASAVGLFCRALDCRHVCTVANGLLIVGCALGCFSPGFLFSLFNTVRTRRLIFIEIEMNSIYDCALRLCLDTPVYYVVMVCPNGSSQLLYIYQVSVLFCPAEHRTPSGRATVPTFRGHTIPGIRQQYYFEFSF